MVTFNLDRYRESLKNVRGDILEERLVCCLARQGRADDMETWLLEENYIESIQDELTARIMQQVVVP